jgi:hypothetical protein
MPEQYSLVVVEKFRKGTDVRVLSTGTHEVLSRQHRETKWVGKRGQPYIIPSEEVEAFSQQHRTGIFVPSYTPPTQAERTEEYERKKRQEAFERERETAKQPTEEGETARALLKTKYGIEAPAPSPEKVTEPTTAEQFQEHLFSAQRQKELQEKIDKKEITVTEKPTYFSQEYVDTDEKEYRGEIQPAEKPPTFAGKIRLFAEKLEYKSFKATGFERQATATGAFVLSAVAVPVEAVTHPVQFTKGLFTTLRHPVKSAQAIGVGLKTQAPTTMGRIAGGIMTGRLIGTGIKTGRVMKTKASPVKVDVTGKHLDIAAVTTPKDAKMIYVKPVKFAAQIEGKKFAGVGAGKGAITKKGLLGAKFKYETVAKGKTPVRTTIGVKAVAHPQKDITKGIAISEAVTKKKGITIKQKGITPFKSKEIVGGDFPRTVVKSGIIVKGKKGGIKPSFGEVSLIKETGTIKTEGMPAVTHYKAIGKGVSYKEITKAFPRAKIGKKAQISPPSFTKPATKFKAEPAPIVAHQFFRGIKTAARSHRISQIKPTTVPALIPSQVQDIKQRQGMAAKLSTTPIAKTDIIQKQKPISEVSPTISIKPAFRITPTITHKPALETKPTISTTPTAPSPFPSVTPTPTTAPAPSPLKFGLMDKKKKKKPGIATSREFRYTPSFTAIALGIKGKVPKKVKGLTGLEPVRPIPIRK